jgi:hypothetical protein
MIHRNRNQARHARSEPDGAHHSYTQCGCAAGAHPEQSVVMKRNLFAVTCLAGLIIAGAAAVAYTAPNSSESGPSLSDSTTTSTTPTTSANAPRPPVHSGY